MKAHSPRILVIRRDNIGDLVCTTPLLHALRLHRPDAYIAVLVSSYNLDVLAGNPDADQVFVFPKRRQESHRLIATLWKRWRLMRELRAKRFDEVLLANGGWRYARAIRGKRMVGFRERDNPDHRQPDVIVPLANSADLHEVEKMAALGQALGIEDALGPLRLFPAPALVNEIGARLAAAGFQRNMNTVGIHISSRNPRQRWPVEHFAALMRRLAAEQPCQFLLFWSPGAENDPMHPGDDAKAVRLIEDTRDLHVIPCPTLQVRELIAALSWCEQLICSDGGAMHIAAALGKPMVCFFGHSKAAEWRPWGVPHVLLQPPSRSVADITVEEAYRAFRQLPPAAKPAIDSRPGT